MESRWVRTEAAEGLERSVLVPVLLDEVRIPLAFRRLQAAPFVGWDGDPTAPEFLRLLADLENLLGRPARAGGASPAQASVGGSSSGEGEAPPVAPGSITDALADDDPGREASALDETTSLTVSPAAAAPGEAGSTAGAPVAEGRVTRQHRRPPRWTMPLVAAGIMVAAAVTAWQWASGDGPVDPVPMDTVGPSTEAVQAKPPPSEPEIDQFEAAPASLHAGDSVALRWRTREATSVELIPGGPVQVEGETVVWPRASTTYALVATGDGGSARRTVSVDVQARPDPVDPPTASLSLEPGTVQAGGYVTMRWSTTRADRVRLEPEVGAVEGSGSFRLLVNATGTRTYRLIAEGPGGRVEDRASVTVTEPPPPPTTVVSFSGRGGAVPDGSQQGVVFDLPIQEPRSIPADGSNVTLTLSGVNHRALVDLRITLEHVGYGEPQWVVDRVLNQGGFICASAFTGTYSFSSAGGGLLRNECGSGGVGSQPRAIPQGAYVTTEPDDITNSGLSSAWNGQPVAGLWRLAVSDWNVNTEGCTTCRLGEGWTWRLDIRLAN